MSLKVGMILNSEFPPHNRILQEALSLLSHQIDVSILCYTSSGKSLSEEYQGIQIKRFQLPKLIQKKLSAAYLVLPVYRWIWTYQIKRFIKNSQPDILHVHDLPLTDIAYKLAKTYKLKLVSDQHEYWSNWIGHTYHYNTWIGKIVKYLSNWKKYEQLYLKKADLVITVSDRLRQIYIQDIGIKPNKIISIPNTPTKRIFSDKNIQTNIVEKYKDYFLILYIGVIDILRGVDLIVKALPFIKDKIPNIRLLLGGRIAKGSHIIDLAASLGVSELVEFIGWIPANQIPSYISSCKVCVYTPPSSTSEEINNTIHTKIYQYVAMKKPIIISDVQMMNDYVVRNELGLSLEEHTEKDLSSKILQVYNSYPEIIMKMEKNVEKIKNSGELYWEHTVEPMLEFYEKNLMSENDQDRNET